MNATNGGRSFFRHKPVEFLDTHDNDRVMTSYDDTLRSVLARMPDHFGTYLTQKQKRLITVDISPSVPAFCFFMFHFGFRLEASGEDG